MCSCQCSYGLASRTRSDPPRFCFPSSIPFPLSAFVPFSSARLPVLSFNSRLPIFQIPQRTRLGTIIVSVASNDAFVASSSPFGEAMSFYELLGIPQTGTLLEIKQAYKMMARKFHPDVSPPDQVEEYTQRFIQVQEAYETLSDPRRRALYDRDMAGGLHLAFSARRRNRSDEMEERSEWKTRWQSQLSELKRRSMNKETNGNMSWATRMRQQRTGVSHL